MHHTRHIAVFHIIYIKQCVGGKFGESPFLQKKIFNIADTSFFFFVNCKKFNAVSRHFIPVKSVVCVPLPLQFQLVRVKIVTCRDIAYRILRADIGLFVNAYGCAVFSVRLAYHRPVVFPFHGLKMNYPACRIHILKMQKPIFARYRIDPCTLMRAVYFGIALHHYISVFVRTPNVFGAQNDLPARFYTACGSKNIIISVTLVKLRTFDSDLIIYIAVKYILAHIYYFCAVGA